MFVLINGNLHWLGYIDEKRVQTITTFDPDIHTFKEMSFPDSIVSSWNVLGVYAGKLCVKHLVFSQLCDGIEPLGFTLRNEFLFYHFNNKALALYDPDDNNVKFLKISNPRRRKPVKYVDSLVWVAPDQVG
ncbi:F-box domain-containing protein [Artemisia annua]|uniref:F-box domain-containing protein n=1 Tax=Artemisia annua TaxID=35608 RepID=A0A2U1LCY4_ARTAN|nr:F-box domain-containing protein [Artemisia annua]